MIEGHDYTIYSNGPSGRSRMYAFLGLITAFLTPLAQHWALIVVRRYWGDDWDIAKAALFFGDVTALIIYGVLISVFDNYLWRMNSSAAIMSRNDSNCARACWSRWIRAPLVARALEFAVGREPWAIHTSAGANRGANGTAPEPRRVLGRRGRLSLAVGRLRPVRRGACCNAGRMGLPADGRVPQHPLARCRGLPARPALGHHVRDRLDPRQPEF